MDKKVIKINYGGKLFTIKGFMVHSLKMKSKICCIENELKAEKRLKLEYNNNNNNTSRMSKYLD